jgi:uncharacterized membrane protein YdbT with pleckstrin-like domain
VADLESRLLTGETVVLSTDKHWIAPLADSNWAILMIIGALGASWLQGEATSGVAGFFNRIIELLRLGLWLGAIGWIAYNIIAWRTAEYHVTNRRVFGQEGLIRRRTSDTLLTSIADVKTTIPALGRALGYGNIRIVSASGDAGADAFTAVKDVLGFKKESLEQKTRPATAAVPASATADAPAAADPPAPVAPAPTGSSAEITATLGELARLRDAGAITPAEFEEKKVQLLARL